MKKLSDEDPTPPGGTRLARARSHWDDDKRAAVGRNAREMEAVPDPTEGANITSPYALLEAELSDEDKETARRTNSPTNAPANVRQLINVAAHGNKHHAENKAAIETLANAVLSIEASTAPAKMAAIDERLDALEATGADVARGLKIVKWVLVAIASSGIGTLIAIADRLWDRAEREGESTIRLQHVEDALKQLGQDIRDDRSHHYSPAPSWLQPPSLKAEKP